MTRVEPAWQSPSDTAVAGGIEFFGWQVDQVHPGVRPVHESLQSVGPTDANALPMER